MSERITLTRDLLHELLSIEHLSFPTLHKDALASQLRLAERYNFEIEAHELGVLPERYFRVGYSHEVEQCYEGDIFTPGFEWKLQPNRIKKKLEKTIHQVVWRKKENEYGPRWTRESALIAMSFGRYVRDAENPVEILEGILRVTEVLKCPTSSVQQAIAELKMKNCQ